MMNSAVWLKWTRALMATRNNVSPAKRKYLGSNARIALAKRHYADYVQYVHMGRWKRARHLALFHLKINRTAALILLNSCRSATLIPNMDLMSAIISLNHSSLFFCSLKKFVETDSCLIAHLLQYPYQILCGKVPGGSRRKGTASQAA